MRFELIHDSIARQVFQKASTDSRLRRKMEKFIFNAYERYVQNETLLTQDDIEYINPYLDAIHLTPEAEAFIGESKESLAEAERIRLKEEAARRQRRNIVIAVLSVLVLISSFATFRAFQSQRETEDALDAARIAEREAIENAQLAEERRELAESAQSRIQAALDETRRAESEALESARLAEERRVQAVAAEEETQKALEDTKEAEAEAREAEKVALEAEADARESARVAEEQRDKAIQARRQTIGLDLASKALRESANDNIELAAMLAREAYRFHTESNGEFPNQIFDGLFTALTSLSDTLSPVSTMIHAGDIRAVAIAPNSQWMAGAGDEGRIFVYASSLRQISNSLGHPLSIRHLRVNPNDASIQTAGDDGRIRRWHIEEDGVPTMLASANAHEGSIHDLAVHAGTGQIASSGSDGQLLLWGGTNEAPPVPLHAAGHDVRSLVFTPDGTRLFGGTANGLLLSWTLPADSETPPMEVRAHDAPVRAMAITPDGQHLASGGDDHRIMIWSTTSLHRPALTLRGHGGRINSLAFDAHGKKLASTSSDRTARIWLVDVTEEEGITIDTSPIVLDEHTEWVMDAVFAPSGDYLITASADQTILRWEIDLDVLANRICTHVDLDLTPDDWNEFVGADIDFNTYYKPCD